MRLLSFDIHTEADAESARFEAANWLDALRLWLRGRGQSAAGLSFDLMADQSVVVTDQGHGLLCRVVPTRRQSPDPLLPPSPVPAAPRGPQPVDALSDPFLDESIEDAPAPAPQPRRLAEPIVRPAPKTLDEALAGLDQLPAQQASAQVLDACQAAFPCEAGSVLLIDARDRTLYFAVARGPEAEAVRTQRVPLEVGLAGACIRTRRSINITDPSTDPRFARSIADTVGRLPRAMVVVPVMHDRRVFGVLELLDPTGRSGFSADEEARVRRAGRRLGQHLAALAG